MKGTPMHAWKELGCTAGMALLLACGGGGSSSDGPPPSLSVSTNEITASASTAFSSMPRVIFDLSFANIPQEGLYYGYDSTSNGIESITDWQYRRPHDPAGGHVQELHDPRSGCVPGRDPGSGRNRCGGQQPDRQQSSDHPRHLHRAASPLGDRLPESHISLCRGSRLHPTPQRQHKHPRRAVPRRLPGVLERPARTDHLRLSHIASAAIPAQFTAAAGIVQITVGGPNRIPSDAIPFPVANSQARFIPFDVNDIAWDEVHQVVYATQGFHSYNSGPYPHSIVVIDPFKSEVKSVVPIDCQIGPLQLAISKECSFLYVSVPRVDDQHFGVVRRYFLPSLAVDPSFSIDLGLDPTGTKMFSLNAMDVDPGNPYTLAIGRSIYYEVGGLAIFDNGVQRGTFVLESSWHTSLLLIPTMGSGRLITLCFGFDLCRQRVCGPDREPEWTGRPDRNTQRAEGRRARPPLGPHRREDLRRQWPGPGPCQRPGPQVLWNRVRFDGA